MKRIAFFGGRDYPDEDRVVYACFAILDRHGPFVLIHGGCHCREDEPDIGADYFAHRWALHQIGKGSRLREEIHWAKWRTLRKAAGPLRNREMVRSGLDGAVQFPGGRGTGDMRNALDAAGVPVWVQC